MVSNELGDLLLECLPADGSTLDNRSIRLALGELAGREIDEQEFDQIKARSLMLGTVKTAEGKGDAIALTEGLEVGRDFKPQTDDADSGKASAKPENKIKIDREKLRLGKYTRWAANLTPDQFYALLWMVGEYGIRSSPDDPAISEGQQVRREAGRKAIVEFVQGKKITLTEAKKAIRASCRHERR